MIHRPVPAAGWYSEYMIGGRIHRFTAYSSGDNLIPEVAKTPKKKSWFRILASKRDFPVLPSTHTGGGSNPASYTLPTEGFLVGSKVAGASS